jgi:hypothetical protein
VLNCDGSGIMNVRQPGKRDVVEDIIPPQPCLLMLRPNARPTKKLRTRTINLAPHEAQHANLRFASFSEVGPSGCEVCFTPANGHRRLDRSGPKSAKAGSRQRYSITSSARASRAGDMSIPSCLAVLRLMTSSNLVGCITGSSEGFSPFKMRPT